LKNKNHTRQFQRRLFKNKPAVAGMILIVIALFIAVFAYLLAPDGSPNANRIIPEVANKKPGFSIDVLQVKRPDVPLTSLLKKIWQGEPEKFTLIPITTHEITNDSVIIQKFIDEGVTERQSFHKKLLAATPVTKLKYYLGSDKFGRDILSRLLIGVRVSLSVGLIALIISLTIGIFLGSIAGYFRGKWDDIIMWFINVIWSIPTLLLVFAITLVLGKGFWQVFIAVGLTMWVNVARLVRGQVLSLREMQFIEATKALGFSNARIIIKHILPNIIGPVMVIAAGNFASAIVIEAGLSFLGVGVQPPQPSWGLMIKENYNFIITSNPMLALIPGIAIMLLVLAFNLLGNGLRDAFNVRGKVN
jgi:ABC-type dipeptide/oligopeptide/nickel transport system permease subunit